MSTIRFRVNGTEQIRTAVAGDLRLDTWTVAAVRIDEAPAADRSFDRVGDNFAAAIQYANELKRSGRFGDIWVTCRASPVERLARQSALYADLVEAREDVGYARPTVAPPQASRGLAQALHLVGEAISRRLKQLITTT